MIETFRINCLRIKLKYMTEIYINWTIDILNIFINATNSNEYNTNNVTWNNFKRVKNFRQMNIYLSYIIIDSNCNEWQEK